MLGQRPRKPVDHPEKTEENAEGESCGKNTVNINSEPPAYICFTDVEGKKNEENTVKCLTLRVKEVAKTIAKSTN